MFGLDSRAAMVQGGALDSMSELGRALLQDKRDRRVAEAQAKDKADERAFRDQQLAQALGIHNDELAFQKDQLKQQREIADQNNSREWWANVGSGIKNAIGMSLKTGKAPEYKPDLWTYDDQYDPKSGTVRKVPRLKTDAELDAEHKSFNHAYGIQDEAAPAVAPATTPDPVVQERLRRNAAVQQEHRAAGLAQFPGDPKPPPSTAGMPAAPMPAPAVAPRTPLGRGQIPDTAMMMPPIDESGAVPAAAGPTKFHTGKRVQARPMNAAEAAGYQKLTASQADSFRKIFDDQGNADQGVMEEAYRRLAEMGSQPVASNAGP